jgi:hypothetical protein
MEYSETCCKYWAKKRGETGKTSASRNSKLGYFAFSASNSLVLDRPILTGDRKKEIFSLSYKPKEAMVEASSQMIISILKDEQSL